MVNGVLTKRTIRIAGTLLGKRATKTIVLRYLKHQMELTISITMFRMDFTLTSGGRHLISEDIDTRSTILLFLYPRFGGVVFLDACHPMTSTGQNRPIGAPGHQETLANYVAKSAMDFKAD